MLGKDSKGRCHIFVFNKNISGNIKVGRCKIPDSEHAALNKYVADSLRIGGRYGNNTDTNFADTDYCDFRGPSFLYSNM